MLYDASCYVLLFVCVVVRCFVIDVCYVLLFFSGLLLVVWFVVSLMMVVVSLLVWCVVSCLVSIVCCLMFVL